MMRYQRVSPECLPLSNGRKSSVKSSKDDDRPENGRIPNFSGYSEAKPLRVRSSSSSATAAAAAAATTTTTNPSAGQEHHFPSYPLPPADSGHHRDNHAAAKVLSHHEINGSNHTRGGDIVLQWGHNKRSRGSRAEGRAAGDEPSSSSRSKQVAKMQRRMPVPSSDKQLAAAMPPAGGGYSRGANLRACPSVRDSLGSAANNRSGEERSGGVVRAETRSPPPPLPKGSKMAAACAAANGLRAGFHEADGVGSTPSAERDGGDAAAPPPAAAAKERLNLDLFEWPRIYLSLSRKEKEDDFLAMKGSKLPQRPKKRAKNIDKTLQYVFPGMWLSDLTRGRYEVREKKSVKKKRRGLKGMESMDSESE
ncbi:unnamed protein product [Spirodela intermedia]|uniref:Uncharacterized protein n=1 Tax=Spirodela intermedia TaxID=51605 RepID=A0A7I8KXS1_SPIIN|nr:unnamed protein product [Spirodela intermedia]